MKFDTKTVSGLKNFSTINPSMLFREGNVIKTIAPNKAVMARAEVPNNFEHKFALYNLSKLLSTISFYDNPDISFNEQNLTVSGGDGSSTTLAYTPEENIKVAPEKDLALPSVDVEFTLTSANLSNIIRMMGVLQLPEISIVGDGTSLFAEASDSKNLNSEKHSEQVGTTDKTFRAIFKAENVIKILSGDYQVQICSRGISKWIGTDIQYWVAVEQNSTY